MAMMAAVLPRRMRRVICILLSFIREHRHAPSPRGFLKNFRLL
jgi:hypothetical protein